MLKDLRDFEKFLKICRKHGATEVQFEGVSVKLSDLPQNSGGSVESGIDIPDEMTDEQMAFYHLQNSAQV